MKKLLFIISFLYCLNPGYAQTINFDKIVPPPETRVKTFEDYLVQLAWANHPDSKILGNEVEIARNKVTLEKKDWTNDVQASFNLNEISLSKLVYGDRIDVPVFYPIYNFTASVNLGAFFTRKHKIKNAQFEQQIAEEEVNVKKLEVRKEVLQRYQKHLLATELTDIRLDAEEDALQVFLLIKERFKLGDAEFEDYNKASSAYISAKEFRFEAVTEKEVSKLELEELIGVSLESARKYGPKESLSANPEKD